MAKKKHVSLNRATQHEILVTTPEAAAKVKGFVDDKHPEKPPMIMDTYGRMVVHDDGIAKEIDDRFGTKSKGGTGEVTVVTIDERRELGHIYKFGQHPEMPWKKEREDAERERLSQEGQEETKEEKEEVDAI